MIKSWELWLLPSWVWIVPAVPEAILLVAVRAVNILA